MPGSSPLIKKTCDAVFSLLILLIALPVIAVLCLLIKLTSSGPVLFKQTRIGKDGKPFVLYKLRSMAARADDPAHESLTKDYIQGNLSAEARRIGIARLESRQRVTPIGRFIRACRADEIPQFINVLKGEMSIVGPRPALPAEIQWYRERHRSRLNVLPGITGLGQVRGGDDLPFEEAVKLDLLYVDDWSLGLDLRIMLSTPLLLLRRRGRRAL